MRHGIDCGRRNGKWRPKRYDWEWPLRWFARRLQTKSRRRWTIFDFIKLLWETSKRIDARRRSFVYHKPTKNRLELERNSYTVGLCTDIDWEKLMWGDFHFLPYISFHFLCFFLLFPSRLSPLRVYLHSQVVWDCFAFPQPSKNTSASWCRWQLQPLNVPKNRFRQHYETETVHFMSFAQWSICLFLFGLDA